MYHLNEITSIPETLGKDGMEKTSSLITISVFKRSCSKLKKMGGTLARGTLHAPGCPLAVGGPPVALGGQPSAGIPSDLSGQRD